MKWLTTLFKKIFSWFGNGRKSKTKAGTAAATAAIIAISTPMIMEHEGLRTEAYLDPIGIPTICFGETLGVKMGDQKTTKECITMLKPRLEGFISEMRRCTNSPVPLPAKTEAALLSFTYNLGSGVYCRNIAGKRINQGQLYAACEALLLYDRAGGKVFRGLTKRRAEEHALCVAGLNERRL